MIKGKTDAEIAQSMINSCIKYYDSQRSADYDTSNKVALWQHNLSQELMADIEFAKTVYFSVLNCSYERAQAYSAVNCLKLEIFVDESVAILESFSNRTDVGMLSIESKINLSKYESGTL